MSRKLVLLTSLMIAVIGMLGIALKAQRVKANQTIYIRADGLVDPSTPLIRRNGNLYTFTDNIFDEIIIEKDNVVVDGAGYTIRGTGDGIGIDLSGKGNITIKNMKIEAFGYGICLYESSNSSIYGNSVTNNTEGIEVSCSSNARIYGNEVRANDHYGVRLGYSSNVTICRNNVTDNEYYGIRLGQSSNVTIRENNITDNGYCGIMLYNFSNNNSICGNNIKVNKQYGIRLQDSSGNFIYHNNFVNNTIQIYTEDSVNVWGDGLEGNYWSDYDRADTNRDGIGDSPYLITRSPTTPPELRQFDYYPLMGVFYSFFISLGYRVNVISNSTIRDFEYFESNGTIRMCVSNVTADQGFCRICIPHELIGASNISVVIDGGLTPVLYQNYSLFSNGTNVWIYFAYPSSAHEIDIIPEFPSFVIQPLFMIATLLAVTVCRRKHFHVTA